MATKNENTTKFKVDISELKKGIQEANRQIKLANAEFKAAAAGMDDWQKSTDGVQSKITSLETVLANQKTILDSYKRQLALISSEYGENSREADEMRIRIANQQAAINGTERSVREFTAQLGNLQREQEEAVRRAQEQSTAYNTLGQKISEQKAQLESLKQAYANAILEQGASSTSATDLARQIENLSTEVQQNEARLREASNAADEFDHSLESVDEEADRASSGGVNAFTVAIGNLVSNVLQAAISKLKDLAAETINVGKTFDTSMSKVGAVSGATSDEMEQLRAKAKEMGSTTKFSASEAADAMNYMAMAGWKTEEMLNGVEGIMNLAAASGEELATTSDIVTDALTALGMTADDSAHFADVLAAASSNANTNVSLMGESFKFVAPVAGVMETSAEDLSIALGLMANSGIKGSQAGNSLKNALVNLTKPTKAQAAAMQQLGFISTETIQKIDFKKVEKAEQDVEDATISLDSAQIKLNDAISKYGESSSQAQLASNNLEKAQLKLARAQEVLEKEQAGVSKEISGANTLMTDSEGNMRSLGEIMGVLREKMGKVNVALTDADGNARDFDDIISELSNTTEGLAQAEQMQAAATIFGKQNMSGMLAIINASEKDYNKLTGAIYGCEGSAKKMADTMLNNLGGDMTLLSSKLEGVQLAIYEKLEPALRKGVEMLDKLLDAVQFVVDHSTGFITALTSMATAVGAYLAYTTALKVMTEGWAALTIVTKAQTVAQTALNFVMSINPIGILIAAIAGLVAAFVVLWNKSEAFRNFWLGLWDSIQDVTIGAIESIADFFSAAWDGIKKAWGHTKEFFVGIWDEIKGVFSGTAEWFEEKWNKIRFSVSILGSKIEKAFINAKEKVQEVWNGIAKWFSDNVINPIKSFFKPLVDFFKSAWDVIYELSTGCWKAIKAVWNVVSMWFNSTVINPIFKLFSTLWNIIKELSSGCWVLVKAVWSVVADWFQNSVIAPVVSFFNYAWNAIKELSTSCWEAIQAVWSVVSGWFNSNIIKPVAELFTDMWDAITSAAKSAWEYVKKVWDIVSIWFNSSVIKPVSKFFAEMWEGIKNLSKTAWDGIKNIWDVVSNWFNSSVIQPISSFFTGMWENLKKGAVDSWEGIKSVFSHVSDWFKDIFSAAWQKVKDVFSTGGKVFDGIKEGIVESFKTVVNAIIRGINKVISIPFNAINNMLDKIQNIDIAGVQPFDGLLSRLPVPEIPELAKGGILKRGQVGILEGNGAEAVVPLENNKRWIAATAAELKKALVSEGIIGNRTENVTNNYNFTQNNTSPKALSRLEIYRQSKNLLNMKGAT